MRFRLRTLLIVVAVLAALLAGVVVPIRQCRQEQAIVADLRARHGANSVWDGALPYWWSGLAKLVGLGHVARVSMVDLQSCRGVSDADLQSVARLRQLLAFNLWYPDLHSEPQDADSRITDAGIEHLLTCSRLQVLNLTGPQVTDAALKHIGQLSQLRFLGLYGMDQVTDKGVADLNSLTRLESVSLSGSSITDLRHGFLSPQCRITHLYLRNTKLTDDGFRVIAGLKSLRELSLGGTAVTDEGLKALVGLSSLHQLELYDTKVGDRGIVSLVNLPLVTVSLSRTTVSVKGIEQLVRIPTLRILTLSETNLDATIVPVLCRMQQLELLDVEGTSITVTDLVPLQQKFPQLEIDIASQPPQVP